MIPLTTAKWPKVLSRIDFAFQPIVNIHTGVSFGYEALLRNHKEAGFAAISDVFDEASMDGVLHRIDLILREKAIEKFSRIDKLTRAKLFYNLDNRVLEPGNYRPGSTRKILEQYSLQQEDVCFEISERHELWNPKNVVDVLKVYRSQQYKIAMDDYGVGFSGLQMLYYTEPDFIKIDRFFIEDIGVDSKKKLFVSNIVNIAHLLGSTVIAEGVETEKEYYVCREIGCDLIQGYLVQYPEQDIGKLQSAYNHIRKLCKSDRRDRQSKDHRLVDMETEYIKPVNYKTDIFEAFELFRINKRRTFFPIVNNNGEPLGVIREKSFKDYAYSRYGTELLQNPAFGKDLNRFISKFPIADIHTPAEKILEIYSQNDNIEGILIVGNMKYRGFLSASSLLKILNEKNLAAARDQNPLSKLPGNTLIYQYVSEALLHTENRYVIVYFDFDNFKPYNDLYGFRNGDRVILLFAELLSQVCGLTDRFIGHIGGDDFFMGVKGYAVDAVLPEVEKLTAKFRCNVESFYDPEARRKGYIVSQNREGVTRIFPILTVSAVILELPENRRMTFTPEDIGNHIAHFKKKAKTGTRKIYTASVEELEDHLHFTGQVFPEYACGMGE